MNIAYLKKFELLDKHFSLRSVMLNYLQRVQNCEFWITSICHTLQYLDLTDRTLIHHFAGLMEGLFVEMLLHLGPNNLTTIFVWLFLLQIYKKTVVDLCEFVEKLKFYLTLTWIKPSELKITYPDEEKYWMLGLFEFLASSCFRCVMHRLIFLAEPEVMVTMLLKNHINPKVTAICTRIQVPIHSIQTFRNLRILLLIIEIRLLYKIAFFHLFYYYFKSIAIIFRINTCCWRHQIGVQLHILLILCNFLTSGVDDV